MIHTIKLMADFGCWPLWGMEESRNIDPETLPLSEQLIHDLDDWVAMFEEDFEWTNTASSEWSLQKLERFELEGIRLWQLLNEELGSRVKVVYFSSKADRVIESLDELTATVD